MYGRHPAPLLTNHSFKWVEEGQLDQYNHQRSFTTTSELLKPLKIRVHLVLRKKKNGGPLMLLGKGEIELKSVGQILQIVHLRSSIKV